MSVSVDDLVASLSANHIGQEATDLAALQAQLAQSLLAHPLSLSPAPAPAHTSALVHGVSVNVVRRDPTSVQHCTTPTARTPSSASCAWPFPIPEQTELSYRRSLAYTHRQSIDDTRCDYDEMAEERAVEDMVAPDSPLPQHAHLWSSHAGSVARALSTSASTPLPPSNMSSPTDSCTPSLFTSTDPFYLQASQSQQSHTSFFSHVGRPSAHSPFLVGVPSWE